MKTILTGKGEEILVDDEDFEKLSFYKWRTHTNGYVRTETFDNGRKSRILMHRLVLGLTEGDGLIVDHINGVKTDNRRSNLRICTHAENLRNRGAPRSNKTGFKGVSFHSRNKRFYAEIKVNGKRKYLGYFDSAQEAHAAYCVAAIELHGEFANFGANP